jgi:hypothetical protein
MSSVTPTGHALVYLYCRDSEAEALQAKVLTKDEARRISRQRGAAAAVAWQDGLKACSQGDANEPRHR